MKPKSPENSDQLDLLKDRLLSQMIDPKHALVYLSDSIDWQRFDDEFGELYYAHTGRPALSTRLMVGLNYLKFTYNLSDENLMERFLENPYWQYFCGLKYFTHDPPCDRSSLSRWRKRMGPEKLELLLSESVEVAKRQQLLKEKECSDVCIDTTVQEKAISFPTDCSLYYKSILKLNKLSKEVSLPLRQSYLRLSRKSTIMFGRYSHSRKMKHAKKEKRKLHNYLGRIIRDIERKATQHCINFSDSQQDLLNIIKKIYLQKPKDSNKIYSIHEPHVNCISKGKAHKKYEFGNKVSVCSTSRNCWIIGVRSYSENIYDGSTLIDTVNHVNSIIGKNPTNIFVDKGYRGVKHHPDDANVYIADKSKIPNPKLWKKVRRRSSVEPVIKRLKHYHRMGKNFLKGGIGDEINAILAGCGLNILKILRAIARIFFSSKKIDLLLVYLDERILKIA